MTEMRSPAPRSTLALDATTGGLRMGATQRRVDDPTDAEQVYEAYLSLLYAVRGARRGEELPLRSADLDALLAIVGQDPEQIERRLVDLMGCSVEEASLLRRVLLRHRALAASVGVAAGLSLVALVGPSVASAGTPAPELSPAPAPVASLEQPPLTSYLTTDDGEHVPVPQDWDAAPVVEDEVVTPAAAPTSPVATSSAGPSASPSPSVTPSRAVAPSASPATSHTPAAPAPSVSTSASSASPTTPAPESEVVLGPPMTPIDREGEVVLGDPMTPIDREGEVVLGDPMTPIDRPAPDATGATPTEAPTSG